jgi:hypothetical protein
MVVIGSFSAKMKEFEQNVLQTVQKIISLNLDCVDNLSDLALFEVNQFSLAHVTAWE